MTSNNHPEDYNFTNGAPSDASLESSKKEAPPYYLKPFWEKTWYEKLCSIAEGVPSVYQVQPRSKKDADLPVQSSVGELVWIMMHVAVVVGLQAMSYTVFPDRLWNPFFAFAVYFVGFVWLVTQTVRRANHFQDVYGVFDQENRGRDRPPDGRLRHLAISVLSYLFIRASLPFYFYYDQTAFPTFRISTLPRIVVWLIALDYFFYVYHRSCHEIPSLWRVHKTHHVTKHPSVLLALLADDVQESIELFFCPCLATILVPMNFHELYLALSITVYVEMMGHSGIRAYWSHPLLDHVLRPLGMELIVEDHDLHHRYGKAGKNYGKQSRVWDKIFGTCAEREETKVPPTS